MRRAAFFVGEDTNTPKKIGSNHHPTTIIQLYITW